jgi:DNA-binding MarR family transcriptional regulator
MKPEHEGGFLITKIHHLGARIFSRKLADYNIEIGPGQGRVIFVLWQEDGISISELAKRTALGKSTLTDLLDRLTETGFLRRLSHPSDRRVTLVTLTDKAREMQDRYSRVSREMTKLFYAGFAPEEITSFEDTLRRILSNLIETEALED